MRRLPDAEPVMDMPPVSGGDIRRMNPLRLNGVDMLQGLLDHLLGLLRTPTRMGLGES